MDKKEIPGTLPKGEGAREIQKSKNGASTVGDDFASPNDDKLPEIKLGNGCAPPPPPASLVTEPPAEPPAPNPPVVEPPAPVVEPPAPVVEPPAPVVEPPVPMIEALVPEPVDPIQPPPPKDPATSTLVESGSDAVVKEVEKLEKSNASKKDGQKAVDKVIENTLADKTKEIKEKEVLVAKADAEVKKTDKSLDLAKKEASTAPPEKKAVADKKVELLTSKKEAAESKLVAAELAKKTAKQEKEATALSIKTTASEKLESKQKPIVEAATVGSSSKTAVPIVATFKGKGSNVKTSRCEGVLIEKSNDGMITSVSRYSCPMTPAGLCPTTDNISTANGCAMTVLDTSQFEKMTYFTY